MATDLYQGYEVVENPQPPPPPIPPSHDYKGGLCPPDFLTCCETLNFGCTTSALDFVKRVAFFVNSILEQKERSDPNKATEWESNRINEIYFPNIEADIRTALGMIATKIGDIKSQAVLSAKEGVYSYDMPNHFLRVIRVWDGCKFLEHSNDVIGLQTEASCKDGEPTRFTTEGTKLFLNRKPTTDTPYTIHYEANSYMIQDCLNVESSFKLLDGFDPIQQVQITTLDMVIKFVAYQYLFERGGAISAMFANNYQEAQAMLFNLGVLGEKRNKAKKKVYKSFYM